jgi:hypothetical protein
MRNACRSVGDRNGDAAWSTGELGVVTLDNGRARPWES